MSTSDFKDLQLPEGILAMTQGTQTTALMSYDVTLIVFVKNRVLSCKKVMTSTTAPGQSKNEHVIIPQTVDDIVDFFSVDDVALALYRKLPPALGRTILESFDASSSTDP